MTPRSPSGPDGSMRTRCASVRRARWNEPERFTASAKSQRSAACGSPFALMTCAPSACLRSPQHRRTHLCPDADARTADRAAERLVCLDRPRGSGVDSGGDLSHMAHVRAPEPDARVVRASKLCRGRGEVEDGDVRAVGEELLGGREPETGRAVRVGSREDGRAT
jgi:hypothetical protein